MSTRSFHGFGKFESSYSFTTLILSSANVNEHSIHGSSGRGSGLFKISDVSLILFILFAPILHLSGFSKKCYQSTKRCKTRKGLVR